MKFEEYKKELEAARKGEIKLSDEYEQVLDEYIKCTDEVIRISSLLQQAEDISRKYNNDITKEKVQVIDADGGKNIILKDDEQEYMRLVQQKKQLMPKSRRLGETLMKMQEKKYNNPSVITNNEESALNSSPIEIEAPSITRESEEENINYNIINTDYYKKLSPELKLEVINKCLDELNKEGEKETHHLSERYNGRKYMILQEKKGIYKNLIERLKSVEKEVSKTIVNSENKNPEIEATPIKTSEEINIPTPVNKSTSSSTTSPDINEIEYPETAYTFNLSQQPFNNITFADLNEYLGRKNIKLNPLVDIKFKNSAKVNLNKAWLCVKNKLSLKKFKNIIPKAFNVDKYVELGAAKLYGKLLGSGIRIRDTGLKFKDGVSQKYNTTKTFVTSVPKKIKDYIKEKYNDTKEYIDEKKDIKDLKKHGVSTLEAMEIVYGENKDNHLDYRIVNRVVNFKDNTCQRVNSMKGKIVTVSKSIRDTIAKPFIYLRNNVRDNVKREELQEQITRIRQENLAKKRVLTNPDLARSRSGYVGSIALISVSIILLSIIIFIGIGSLMGR